MRPFIAFVSALLFGLGLGISGMTKPENIIGFLDITGHWNPVLILVMVGAISTHMVSFYFIKKRRSPLLTSQFQIPLKKHVDGKLITGSIVFGVGWGLGGFCPGPAVVSLITFDLSVLIFTGSMVLGMAIFHYLIKPHCLKTSTRPTQS